MLMLTPDKQESVLFKTLGSPKKLSKKITFKKRKEKEESVSKDKVDIEDKAEESLKNEDESKASELIESI